jgi:Domain of unknown function (DUF4136)
MKARTLSALAIATFVTASAYGENITATTDSSAPFASYQTYAWTAGTTSPDALTERRIHAAVEAQMSGKVIRLAAPDESPDLFVATHVVARDQKDFAAGGFASWAPGAGPTIDSKAYGQGTLVVDVYDAKTKQIVWRGVAIGMGSDKPSKNSDKIDKALADLFHRYPSLSN